jgi:hypothetical protein
LTLAARNPCIRGGNNSQIEYDNGRRQSLAIRDSWRATSPRDDPLFTNARAARLAESSDNCPHV